MNAATDTYVLLRAFVDELVRCGMRIACTSPGSRCAPLVLSLAREGRLRCYSHVDERCAGFFALGTAKASGRPVAVACTSGTAAAELLPAAVEAHEARVPLLLLTADRPPELRENGAGQAIDQLKLFGGAAKWFFEVGTHEVGTHDAGEKRLRWIRTLACRAYWSALEGQPGVVHLNFPLREPLVTDEPLPSDATGRADGRPYVLRRGPAVGDEASNPHTAGAGVDEGIMHRRAVRADAMRAGAVRADAMHARAMRAGSVRADAMRAGAAPATEIAPLREALAEATRGVVVAGRHERATPLGEAAARFCAATGWPLLADPLSGARRGTAAIAHYDALLRDKRFAAARHPDLVLRVGDLPVSKPLREWLADLADVRQVTLDPEGAWQDPGSVLSDSLALEPALALTELAESPPPTDPEWLAAWRSADERAARAIRGALDGNGHSLDEPTVTAELGVLLPQQTTLFVASSMPVRDIETFWPVRADPPRVLCNRGANGIDGTVASAFGAAATGTGPVVLLIGDVALAHDLGSLLCAKRLGLGLTIVLVDNGGGGIFDFLPVSRARLARRELTGVGWESTGTNRQGTSVDRQVMGADGQSSDADRQDTAADNASDSGEDHYTSHIATPTGLDFARAATLYDLAYAPVRTIPELRSALEQALTPLVGSTLIHVRTDRAENVALHGRVWSAVSEALREGQEVSGA